MNHRKHGKPAIPEQTPGPTSLILSHEIMKLGTFTNLNKRRKGTFTEKGDHHHQVHHKSTWNRLHPDPTKEKPIPNTPNRHTPKQSLVPLPDMRRSKELQGAMYFQQRPASKTFPTAKIGCNLVTPSIKKSGFKMLHKASQVAKQK